MQRKKNTNQADHRSDGRTRILDAAERLFAEKGYDGCSMREIAAVADINVGLIHYFFRTKENLFRETYLRRGTVITRQRIKLLDEAEHETSNTALSVDKILELFLTPSVEFAKTKEGRWFARIQSRLQQEDSEFSNGIRSELYDESSKRYVEALTRVLPHLPPDTIYWRFVFMLGTYQYVLSNSSRRTAISGKKPNRADEDRAYKEMIAFLSAGMQAPPAGA